MSYMAENPGSALARERWKKATPEDRAEAAQTMLDAKTPEKLSEIGRKAAAARWRSKKTKKKPGRK